MLYRKDKYIISRLKCWRKKLPNWDEVVANTGERRNNQWAKVSLKVEWHNARGLTPVIPALWEAKAGGSRSQEIETILFNMVKPVSTKNTKISWVWWHAPVVPTTREAEAGESLELRRWRLQWAKVVPLYSSLATEQDSNLIKRKIGPSFDLEISTSRIHS